MFRSPDDRRRWLRVLDDTERHVVSFYVVFLALVTVVVLVGSFYVLNMADQGFWSQGGLFYLGLALLLFFGWVIGQFVAMGRRISHRTAAPDIQLDVKRDGNFRSFSISLNPGRVREDDGSTLKFSKQFHFGTTSLAQGDLPGDSEVEQADRYQKEGMDWELICLCLNPDYSNWPEGRQQLYRTSLQSLVEMNRQAVKPPKQESESAPEAG